MTTKTKSTKTKSPVEQAEERLEARRTALESHEAREQSLAQKVTEHESKAEAGAMDYDALGHIEDSAALRAERQWIEIQRPHLAEDQKVYDAHAIAEEVGNVEAQRQALTEARAEAVQKISKALEEYDAKVFTFNGTVLDGHRKAQAAGLDEETTDPSLPISHGGGKFGRPLHLNVNGTAYDAVRPDVDALLLEAKNR